MNLLKVADTGITNIRIQETTNLDALRRLDELAARRADNNEVDQDGLDYELRALRRESVVTELMLEHGNAGELFGIEDESDGTRNWLSLLPLVVDALAWGDTLVVDEIDASLHPLLTVKLLQLFSNVATNPLQAQLVFTTHGTTPLGSYVDSDVLQRDQVWFVEKNAEGQSRLYPLSDFKPRAGENTERRYLGGSYGAVPVLDEFSFEEVCKAHMTRRENTRRRRAPFQEPRTRLLVVCGGAVTEPTYFAGLKKLLRNPVVQVRVLKKGVDPESLVEYAASVRRHYPDTFDEI